MTGVLTLEIQGLMRPELDELFEELGHDLTVVRGGSGSTFGTPASSNTLTTPVRGLLMPASTQRRTVAGASELPIPVFVAYLPFEVDLSEPGWHIVHMEQRYYPTRDAYSPGNQGVMWVCELGSPGEVTRGPG